jgi:hypothetical protein
VSPQPIQPHCWVRSGDGFYETARELESLMSKELINGCSFFPQIYLPSLPLTSASSRRITTAFVTFIHPQPLPSTPSKNLQGCFAPFFLPALNQLFRLECPCTMSLVCPPLTLVTQSFTEPPVIKPGTLGELRHLP